MYADGEEVVEGYESEGHCDVHSAPGRLETVASDSDGYGEVDDHECDGHEDGPDCPEAADRAVALRDPDETLQCYLGIFCPRPNCHADARICPGDPRLGDGAVSLVLLVCRMHRKEE